MHMTRSTPKVYTSLTVSIMTLSRFLKLVQLLANLNTLNSLTPLKAENAPPVDMLLL